MNTLVERELPLLEQTLSLRTQLLDVLTDADLGHALPGNPSLGELCREAGQFGRDLRRFLPHLRGRLGEEGGRAAGGGDESVGPAGMVLPLGTRP